jgi:hypothetical protein
VGIDHQESFEQVMTIVHRFYCLKVALISITYVSLLYNSHCTNHVVYVMCSNFCIFYYRSWEKMYIKLNGSTICCYKDQKTAKNHPDSYYKGEPPIELRGGSVEKASDYTKKTNVFRVK